MEFLNSYKRLEKLCEDLLNDDRKVTAYIEEMKETPGEYYVKSWYDDFYTLKRYRHIRNQIVHDPDYTEANTCSSKDVQWIEDFCTRIINRTDPLALYYKAKQAAISSAARPKANSTNRFTANGTAHPQYSQHENVNGANEYSQAKRIVLVAGIFIIAFLTIALLLIPIPQR